MRRIAVVLLVLSTLALSAVPAMALTPVRVIVGRGDQYWASSNGTYLAWTSHVNNTSNAYVRRLPGGTPRRVSAAGTRGEQPSFVGTTSSLVYDQWTRTRQGDIYFYNVSTGRRTKAPAAVNKAKTFEWAPKASANYLLFMRHRWSPSGRLLGQWLLFYDRHTLATRILETGVTRYFRPEFAGNTYVAWVACGAIGCRTHYWSEAGGERVQPAAPYTDQMSATIDEATSQIYYGQTRTAGCGRHTTIRRATLGSARSWSIPSTCCCPPWCSVSRWKGSESGGGLCSCEWPCPGSCTSGR